eukprot:CAMPEP_0170626226 /NCGR_PEP_ID=MMETSP0224-20130122/31234_1 /TAXON_ID=285029 /ORGANISM="Togula jolla, Strain CCCM 725" /LENGTH=512 /DNA_ID=CAMNT_0010952963 /DNA_START=18 /DNA_END=1553 /DNA_ORIENTATION=-
MFRSIPCEGTLSLQDIDPNASRRMASGGWMGAEERAPWKSDNDDSEADFDPDSLHSQRLRAGATILWHKELTRQQRVQAKREWDQRHKPDLGLQTVAAFRQELRRRYGSLLRAWREIDRESNGRVTFGEFFLALERFGMHGDFKGIWGQLVQCRVGSKVEALCNGKWRSGTITEVVQQQDGTTTWTVECTAAPSPSKSSQKACRNNGPSTEVVESTSVRQDGKGHLVFADIDFKTDKALTDLKGRLVERYGSTLSAWIKGIDINRNGFVSRDEFIKACSEIGYEAIAGISADQIFDAMRPEDGMSMSFLTLEDFDEKAYWAMKRGDFRMISDEGASTEEKRSQLEMSFSERQEAGCSFQLQRAWDVAKRRDLAKACKTASPKEFPAKTPEKFEQLCIRRYGSMIGAWRQCLDADHNGKLSFLEFCEACRKLGYTGDLKALFKKYDPGRGYILLGDLDARSDRLIRSFFSLLQEQFGSLDKAWRKGFGKDRHESIDAEHLEKACCSLGYPHDA